MSQCSFVAGDEDEGLGFDDILTATPSSGKKATAAEEPTTSGDTPMDAMKGESEGDSETKTFRFAGGEDVPSSVQVNSLRHENGGNSNEAKGGDSSSSPGKDAKNEEVIDRQPTSYSDSSSESSSSSSDSDGSDSDDDSDDETEVNGQNSSRVERLHQLKCEIDRRQKKLAKLLRGREGTSYARMLRSQEDAANARLMEALRIKDSSTEGTTANASRTSGEAFRLALLHEYYHTLPGAFALVLHCCLYVIVYALVSIHEYYHTLPGAFALVLHCCLYVIVYALVSKVLVWLCDAIVICLTGWHITQNWFDCTLHEHVFYSIVLFLSLILAKITGVVYDWNEGKLYQKRIDFQWRNKWHLKCWDAKLANYFYGDELREEFECSAVVGVKEACAKKKKVWGPRSKFILDALSFFLCYKCVDYFVYNAVVLPFSDVTQTVLDGLPSRQLRQEPDGDHPSVEKNGYSYACDNVMSALENPFAADMLNWMASIDLGSPEAKNWIMNAKKCGWTSMQGADENTESRGNSDAENSEHDDLTESDHPPLITQKQIVNPRDEKYLEATIPVDQFYELFGEPTPQFHDGPREHFALVASAALCVGMLYWHDIPFLLI
eukprot:CAMPEP_0183746222 /NCGR_PEP_ID=MMETSP0737-20130205/66642_1 /TAXON_ID=385413 /ORGANISM="Thalassiosira miniscula, Strain CCMP1093" /LENGTH=606 /DNA_ID=CAMNT_0025981909 /DNA_START=74 /DNA_END=1894 /DNA_ORIENTATION=+